MAKFRKVKWALRRLDIALPKNFLVLEVGSGGNPYPRSNVLVDAYEETQERHWETLIHDRPTVLARGEKLPFKDKAFDYVIAAHVLEHTADPVEFLAELERVAKAGYIETPDAFMERINPYKDHRLEVTVRNDALVIRKKPQWIVDTELFELYEQRAKNRVTRKLIPEYPEDFHSRFYWQDKIDYEVINPEVDASWQSISDCQNEQVLSTFGLVRSIFRKSWLSGLRTLFSQNQRNKKIDLLALLLCPCCGDDRYLESEGDAVLCENCDTRYQYRNDVLVMHETK